MQLNVNFVYTANVRHKRKVNAVERKFLGTVPVEVPEAAPEDAPVVFRLLAPLSYERAPGCPLELRRHGDRLYVPIFLPPSGNRFDVDVAAHRPQGAGWLAEIAESGWRRQSDTAPPLPVGSVYDRDPAPTPIGEEPDLREVTASEEGKRAAEIAERAAALLVVDGVVHVPCPEPVYQVSYMDPDRRRNEPGYNYLTPVFGRLEGERRDRDREYRADELAYLRETKSYVRVDPKHLIEVLDPDAVREDIPQRRLLATAQKVCEWMRGRVAERDVPFFRTYYDLRETLARDGLAIARGDCARGGGEAVAAHAALARIADAVDETLRQVDEIADDLRREVASRRDRVEAVGAWRDLDAAAIPAA